MNTASTKDKRKLILDFLDLKPNCFLTRTRDLVQLLEMRSLCIALWFGDLSCPPVLASRLKQEASDVDGDEAVSHTQ